jgi:hypothetical protein
MSGQIHISLRFGEYELVAFVPSVYNDCFGLQFHSLDIKANNKSVNNHEANIMAIIPKFSSRITEADD